MADEWIVEHVDGQDYDILSRLEYIAKDILLWARNVYDPESGNEEDWRARITAVQPGEGARVTLATRLAGYAAPLRVQISWTSLDGHRHTGTYLIPHPGRTRPDLRPPVPAGFVSAAGALATRSEGTPTDRAPRKYAEKVSDVDPREVFVVVGRNSIANRSMFDFLRAINLKPIEWSAAIASTGSGSPYIGDALESAFARAKAVVVFMTPDDIAQLRPDYASGSDDPELTPMPQSRPNVLLEAGMALGLHPERTIIVELGTLRGLSDLAGRHTVRIDNSPEKRNDLANRLRNAGCAVDTGGPDWYSAGDFTPPKVPGGPRGRRLPSNPAPQSTSHLDAGYFHRSSGSDRIEIQNVGSEEVLDLTSPNVKEFRGRIDGFPIARLPVGKSATLIVMAAMGRADRWDLVINGRTVSGEEFSESLFLDLNG